MKLEEITNRIYAEGVEKGNAEAKVIIDQAQDKAAAIIAEAEQKAQQLMANAEQKAAELDKNTRSELRMFAEQSVNALRTEVANLITGQIAADSVKAATADKAFMQGIITKMAENMAKNGEVIIDAKDAAALQAYFAANAKDLLNKGVRIQEVKGLKTDFQIRPEKGGYKLAFGDAEFVAYFKEFIRPQLVEMLF
jgi:V/A-type H+-transporting ATPase subunit E